MIKTCWLSSGRHYIHLLQEVMFKKNVAYLLVDHGHIEQVAQVQPRGTWRECNYCFRFRFTASERRVVIVIITREGERLGVRDVLNFSKRSLDEMQRNPG
jgi:hypothetical protein